MHTGKCVENIEANLGPRGLAGKARARRLVWGSAEELALFQPPYDVVLAGDCLYEEACISPLLQTMWALAGPETEVGKLLNACSKCVLFHRVLDLQLISLGRVCGGRTGSDRKPFLSELILRSRMLFLFI